MNDIALPYYTAYEQRYKAVYASGVERWGHSPSDEVLTQTLAEFVKSNGLVGRKVIDFACGEGACGYVLSRLGCLYHGVDISVTAIAKAREMLAGCVNARLSLLDCVNHTTGEAYAAAVDCMGYHMLVTTADRRKYLKNIYASLESGAPLLLFRELHREDAYDGEITDFKHWLSVSGLDYSTPEIRTDASGIEISIPLVPARAMSKKAYAKELSEAGFTVEHIVEMDINREAPYSVSIFARKIQYSPSSSRSFSSADEISSQRNPRLASACDSFARASRAGSPS